MHSTPQQSTSPIRRVVLTGFMGSGKSTVGPLLAARLAWRFVDADDEIVRVTGQPIADYFRQHGEPAFRAIEEETIAHHAEADNRVLSLGGGAMESASTRSLLLAQPGTLLVHLDVTFEEALARCAGTDASRPILADRANLEARYTRRQPLYRQAHCSIAVDALSPQEVVAQIIQQMAP